MRIPSEKNGKKLNVHTIHDFYSFTLYQDFKSLKDLKEFLQNEGLISNKKNNRYEFEYYYTK